MPQILVVLKSEKSRKRSGSTLIKSIRGRILQTYGPHVLIVEATTEQADSLKQQPDVLGVFEGQASDKLLGGLDETGKMGVAAWNERHTASFRAAKKKRKGEGMAWDHPDYDKEG
jgi:hypothetical protein